MTKNAKRRHKGLSDSVALAKHKNSQRNNPFDLKYNRVKQQVMSTRNRFDSVRRSGMIGSGRPMASRKRSMESRSVTLMSEYKKKGKKNIFKDRRIGESQRFTEEEKLAKRFAAERIRRSKRTEIYKLDEANEDVLKHHGQSILEIERFDRPSSDSDDEPETGAGLNADFVSMAHFGGDEPENPNLVGPKTPGEAKAKRKQLLDDLVKLSKHQKQEQQMLRETIMDKTDELDAQWKLVTSSKVLSAMLTQMSNNRSCDDNEDKANGDDYGDLVKQLMLEGRCVKAADRPKSEDELARKRRQLSEGMNEASTSRTQYLSMDEAEAQLTGKISKRKNHASNDNGFEVRYGKNGQLLHSDKLEPPIVACVPINDRNRVYGGDDDDDDDDISAGPSEAPTTIPKEATSKGFKFLEPRLELDFDPERKRSSKLKGKKGEQKKLQRQYKKEFRGAVRELRKDAQFIARAKLKDRLEKDDARKQKTKMLMASLMDQESEYKKLKRLK